MGSINAGRVVMGGLLAGLVINVLEFLFNGVLFAEQMREWTEAHNFAPASGAGMAVLVLLGFVGGVVLVWIYAAMRPRFGPGPKTAVAAGLAVWTFAYFWPIVGFTASGFFPHSGLTYIGLAWGVVEFALAAMAGGWLYREAGGMPAAP